jgi:arylsulfatase A-like enzyme
MNDKFWEQQTSAGAVEKPFTAKGSRPTKRPNLIFILADDMGWGDLSCFGSNHINTPNIDRIAANGVRFTHAYSASPWCSPARLGLYTGKNPGKFRAGLEEPLDTRADWNGIPHDHPTLPSMLRDVGYRTAMFGKWHCGWLPWFSPLKIGFETFFGNLDGAMDYFTHIDTLGLPDLYEGETPVGMEGYYTDLISDRAVEYVSACDRDEQFYLQVNYNAPHWPWEGRDDRAVGDEIQRRYTAGEQPLPILHSDAGSLAKYAEMIEQMDEGIGRILGALDATGRAEDTLICFCSDNGGERYSAMWPFIGEKGDVHEGGIRVPFVASWPAAIAGQQVSEGHHILMDWTATFLDAAGTGPSSDVPLDGVSLLPWLLDGSPHPDHDLFWRVASQGALRRGQFKYVFNNRDQAFLGSWPRMIRFSHRLYDLSGDGREVADVSRHHPEVLATLRTEWERINSELLPYPAGHRGVPRRATASQPAISQPD